MTRSPTCPSCRKAGIKRAAGPHPAGRCDECQADFVARAAACVDCLAEGREPKKCRPVDPKQPGRRCVTHGRAFRKRSKLVAHGAKVESGYGIGADEYWALYEAQGGRCAGCRKGRGISKRLAVDHDHTCKRGHPPNVGCRYCIRALLCSTCNNALGRIGPQGLRNLLRVFYDHPAQEILNPELETV